MPTLKYMYKQTKTLNLSETLGGIFESNSVVIRDVAQPFIGFLKFYKYFWYVFVVSTFFFINYN